MSDADDPAPGGDDLVFGPVAQPVMDLAHVGPGSSPHSGREAVSAIIDNRTNLPDSAVREAVCAQWVEMAGLQFAQPNNFQLYANNQGSMLARTPFQTPRSVIDEIKLARDLVDTDDDVGAVVGNMLAIAYGEGLKNQHRDENTLEFFNQITAPTGMDLETVLEEMHREFLIAGSVTTLNLFSRKRMEWWPPKSDTPVQAQLQVPRVGILPAENVRVISNDVFGEGVLAYHVEDFNLKTWLDEYLNPRTDPLRRSIMANMEPVAAALFTGRIEVPYTDGDPLSRGLTLYTLNPRMVHRTTMPKGSSPYPRPILTRDFSLLEAKRLLNIMDYALLQGGTNYIVIAKQGSDDLPAQQPEIDALAEQVTHASRSGVMVGDHRLSVEIVTPNLEELLNPAKRKLLGRKISMGIMRQPEQVTGDSGTQGAANEMEFTSRVVSSDRRKLIRHVHSTVYDEIATRNRTVFREGPPSIWGPKIVLAGAKDFWANVLQARDRGDIPRRWVVEALGYDYDAGLAEREREIARGDDLILTPGSVPFSQAGGGQSAGPQDNGTGRPVGTSSNNGRGADTPGQGQDPFAPNHVIRRTAGETIKAIVEEGQITYIGETTQALIEAATDGMTIGYVTAQERECIDANQAIRAGNSMILPVNADYACSEYTTAKLGDGLRVVMGKRIGDDAIVAKALRFSEPTFDILRASEYAIRWGFSTEPLVEVGSIKRCKNCGNELPGYSSMNPVCPSCGEDNSGSTYNGGGSEGEMAQVVSTLVKLHEESLRRMTELAERQQAPILVAAPPTPEAAPTDGEELARKFTQAQRDKAVKDGAALPDGSFPIYNQGELDDAVGLVGNSNHSKAEVVAHIRKRAKDLSLTLPDSWKGP